MTLEIGRRRSFAQAVDWPGWCRAGRDENLAVANLAAYADRYRAAVGSLADPLGTGAPEITVIERVDGDVTTDFGAPGQTVPSDRRPLAQGEPQRLAAFLDACWAAFDAALAATPEDVRARQAAGRPLPGHDADAHPRTRCAPTPRGCRSPCRGWSRTIPARPRDVIRGFVPRACRWRCRVGVPFEDGKRTGPYAVRRECWHVLDHAWELEDRLHAT